MRSELALWAVIITSLPRNTLLYEHNCFVAPWDLCFLLGSSTFVIQRCQLQFIILAKGSCLSPVNLTTHPQLDFQTLEPLWLREALGIFCHYFPVIVFVVLSVKYNNIFLTLLDIDSEILLEFNLLISAQWPQILGVTPMFNYFSWRVSIQRAPSLTRYIWLHMRLNLCSTHISRIRKRVRGLYH